MTQVATELYKHLFKCNYYALYTNRLRTLIDIIKLQISIENTRLKEYPKLKKKKGTIEET